MLFSYSMTPEEINIFFETLARLMPDPRGELSYISPFTLVVAVVLSAQATDKGVNKVTPFLFDQAKTPEEMIALGEEKIRNIIKPIGFSTAKARHLIGLSQRLLSQYQGQVPSSREELMTLPGVGRKTANVVMNIAFNQPTIAVDTHVFRVSNRTGLATGKTPEKVEEGLVERIPKKFQFHAHHWLILHGRYVCKALKPLCATCPVVSVCHYPNKNI